MEGMERSTALGSREVTLKEVARVAGVHISTASRALDPTNSWRISAATVERVRRAASDLGYRPDMVARGLKRRRTTSIGVVVSDLENPFVGPLIRGIVTSVEARGFVVLVTESFDEHERFAHVLDHLVSRRVDAIITTAAHESDADLLRGLVSTGTPIVLAVRAVEGADLPSVTNDDVHGGRLALDHLAELGHEVVAQLCGPPDIRSFVDRGRAFAEHAAASALVDRTIEETAHEPTVREGRRLMELTLGLGEPRPTGIFAHNDLLAIGAMDATLAAGLACPGDVSIVGYNDAPLVDHLSPPLTSVRLPGEEIGRLAAELAVAAIEDPTAAPRAISLDVTLVVRGSSGPAPRARSRPA
jgi:LacI family transcriptional regulator